MGLPSREPFHARHRDGPHRPDDRRQAAQPHPRPGPVAAGLIAALLWALPAAADTLRIATFDAGLTRKGPGLLARDIARGDPQVRAAAKVIARARPDVILLTGIDWDDRLVALTGFQTALAEQGVDLPHAFALRPNTGLRTGIDLDGDGRAGGPGDAQGFGRFPGQKGMAILSRLDVEAGGARDFSALLWRDLPDSLALGAGLSDEAIALQRLSTTGHWDVPLTLPGGGALHLLAFAATPPVFDGPEDRNGRRNHDETAFWSLLLDGRLPWLPPAAPFVILGTANLDPVDGDGRRDALVALLADPRLTGTAPQSPGAAAAGDPADTTDWAANPTARRNLRVDYVLPSASLAVTGSGVFWPAPADPFAATVAAASDHRLVWVDVALP